LYGKNQKYCCIKWAISEAPPVSDGAFKHTSSVPGLQASSHQAILGERLDSSHDAPFLNIGKEFAILAMHRVHRQLLKPIL
jgi:hypothetical protein